MHDHEVRTREERMTSGLSGSTGSRVPRVLNKRSDVIPREAVYVGRPTKWGNPFVIGRDGNRDDVVRRYRDRLLESPTLLAQLGELRGRDLVCWCAPLPCHADVLLEFANRLTRTAEPSQ